VVAVAHKQLTDSIDTGHQLADEASDSLGRQRPAWGLMMVGGQHEGTAAFNAAHGRLGEIPLIGGACAGTISPAGVSYSGFESSLMLFESAPEAIIVAQRIGGDEYAAGRNIGTGLAPHLDGSATVLLFYDTTRPDGAGLVVGSELLDGIYSILGEASDCILGAGLIGDQACAAGFVFTGGACERGAAVAVVLPKGSVPDINVMHGVVPLGSVHQVTAAKGTRIQKLDGRPAVEVLMDDLSICRSDLAGNPIEFSVLLGRRPELDPRSVTDTDGMVIRLIVGMDLEAGWVQLFESDIGVGDRLEVMLRDPHSIFESVGDGAARFSRKAAEGAAFGLYIDCAGRTAPFSGTETDEAAVVAEGVPEGLPFLGFYAGREIAPVRGRSRPHDWTGILVSMGQAA
jgi:hypothetical protein